MRPKKLNIKHGKPISLENNLDTTKEREFEFRLRLEQEMKQPLPSDNQTGLQKTADKITGIMQSLNNPGPGMQNVQVDTMEPQGDALFNKAGLGLTEFLGKHGVPGTAAAVPGTLLSMLNPMSNVTPAKVPEIPEMPVAAKAVSQFGEMLTGKSTQKFQRLIKDPGVTLPKSLGGAQSVPEATVAYGRDLGKEGLTKPRFNPFDGNKSAMDLGGTTWEKWRSGFGKIDPQEAYDATQAVKHAFPAAITERNAEKIQELMQFKDAMNTVLENQKGKFKKVSEDYGRAKLKEDFSQWLPRTQTGKISTVKSLGSLFINAKRLPFLALTSPRLFGGAVAAGSAALKGLNILGQNPAIRTTLLQVLQQLMSSKQQTKR